MTQDRPPTFNEWRPPDHPAELPWPPDFDADEDSDLLSEELRFGELATQHAFGSRYLKKLKRVHPDFAGNWWALAFLSRSHEYVKHVDEGCKFDGRYKAWKDWWLEFRLFTPECSLKKASLRGVRPSTHRLGWSAARWSRSF